MFVVAGIDRSHTDSAADSCLYRCNPIRRVVSADAALAASKVSNRKTLTIDGMRDDLLSPRQNAATRCTHFSTSGECSFNGCAIIC
jgi:hypothetical protein